MQNRSSQKSVMEKK